MSGSSPSPQPLQQEQADESDVVRDGSLSLNQETPNQPDPPPKSDPETLPPPQPILDPEDKSPEVEEDDDDEEGEGEEVEEAHEPDTSAIPSGMSLQVVPPIIDPHVSVPFVTLTSPTADPSTRRVANKRKKGKGKGKGKGKPNIKKQQAIEEKLQTLMTKLNPIPFIPHKLLDFAKHEKLLKKLGLWHFVHIDFDRNIRVDLIAQLVATYNPKLRSSYVNDLRIMVNRADLARAFRLPLKKDKGNVGGAEVDLDCEALSDDSIGFIVELVLDWMLLHEDMWMMPNEVMDWLKVIKDGHPEKVDWAGLFWFMVEKELKQGGQLRDCYYASHLQHVIKFQREELFLKEEPAQLDAEAKEEEDEVNDGDVNVSGAVGSPGEDCEMGGPSTELKLGQDGETEEVTKDVEMMDVEKCKESDEEGGGDEQGQWLLHGKNDMGEHLLQRCGAENAGGLGSLESGKEEEEEEEEEETGGEDDEEEIAEKFDVFPNDDALEGNGFTGNLLQAMEANQMAFGSQEQLHNPSSVDIRADMQHIASTPSFFNNAGKRVIEPENNISHHYDSNKRLRISDSLDHKPVDFGMCMEQIQQMSERARMFYEEKEQALEQSNMNQQILLTELQKRDSVIEHLHKARLDEIQKKDGEIYRLERELYLMGSVLDGYRKALKETQKLFAEYRERAQLPEEPTYKDVGLGGLMLTAPEIEKLRKKQEEEYKLNCLVLEQKMKEAEEDYVGQFDGYVEKIKLLDEKLTALEANAKELIELHAKRKVPQTEETVPEVAEPLATPETEEKVPEVAEPLAMSQTEEKVSEVAEPLAMSQTEEVPEVAEPLQNE
ncbi:uncharacterized protein LOC105178452 [Sesamum indicum]|uniref:Uncharacterized protein LOC105178452 n=1 Tax=Sesamum indicum TaxID=4182 RepID=A0A6I9UFN9_SESIN|nr:uncharacterized protein LOC105178452 [Sesamum indicum]